MESTIPTKRAKSKAATGVNTAPPKMSDYARAKAKRKRFLAATNDYSQPAPEISEKTYERVNGPNITKVSSKAEGRLLPVAFTTSHPSPYRSGEADEFAAYAHHARNLYLAEIGSAENNYYEGDDAGVDYLKRAEAEFLAGSNGHSDNEDKNDDEENPYQSKYTKDDNNNGNKKTKHKTTAVRHLVLDLKTSDPGTIAPTKKIDSSRSVADNSRSQLSTKRFADDTETSTATSDSKNGGSQSPPPTHANKRPRHESLRAIHSTNHATDTRVPDGAGVLKDEESRNNKFDDAAVKEYWPEKWA